jgi:hypothetical protein
MDQLSFASLDYAAKKKRTKRDVFLAEMAAGALGRARSFDRAALSQGWSERRSATISIGRDATGFIACSSGITSLISARKKSLYDICSMRTFAGLELGRDTIPDETTILNFRHLLRSPGAPCRYRQRRRNRSGKLRAKSSTCSGW